MSSFQATDNDQDQENRRDREDEHKRATGNYPFEQGDSSNPGYMIGKVDPYRGMLRLREMLRGGKITKSEYEVAKIELLFEDE
jgi:hypothetical protein